MGCFISKDAEVLNINISIQQERSECDALQLMAFVPSSSVLIDNNEITVDINSNNIIPSGTIRHNTMKHCSESINEKVEDNNLTNVPAPNATYFSDTIALAVMIVSGTPGVSSQVDCVFSSNEIYKIKNDLSIIILEIKNQTGVNLVVEYYHQNGSLVIDVDPISSPVDLKSAEALWRNPALAALGFAAPTNVTNSEAIGEFGLNKLIEDLAKRVPGASWKVAGFWSKYPFHITDPVEGTGDDAYSGEGILRDRFVIYYNSFITQYHPKGTILHELLHLFGACDEYEGAGVTDLRFGGEYLVPNYNNVDLDPLLQLQDYTQIKCVENEISETEERMCYFTRGQIGLPWIQPCGILSSAISPLSIPSPKCLVSVMFKKKMHIFFINNNKIYETRSNDLSTEHWYQGSTLGNYAGALELSITDVASIEPAAGLSAVVYNSELYVFFMSTDTNDDSIYFIKKKTAQFSDTKLAVLGGAAKRQLSAFTYHHNSKENVIISFISKASNKINIATVGFNGVATVVADTGLGLAESCKMVWFRKTMVCVYLEASGNLCQGICKDLDNLTSWNKVGVLGESNPTPFSIKSSQCFSVVTSETLASTQIIDEYTGLLVFFQPNNSDNLKFTSSPNEFGSYWAPARNVATEKNVLGPQTSVISTCYCIEQNNCILLTYLDVDNTLKNYRINGVHG